MTLTKQQDEQVGIDLFSILQLYDKQAEAFLGGGPKTRFRLVEASSGCGKTYAMDQIAGCYTIYIPRYERTIWLAPSYTVCRIGFDGMLESIPETYREFMERTNAITSSAGNMKISFGTLMQELGYPGMGGTVDFRSAEKPDLIYGGRYRAGFGEESSRNSVLSKNAMVSTLSKGGEENPAFYWGNVTDRYNWFYELCREVEHMNLTTPFEEQRYHYASLTWRDAIEAQQRDGQGNLLFNPDQSPVMVQTLAAIEDARFELKNEPGRFEALYENIPLSDQTRPFPDSVLDLITTTCQCGAQESGAPVLCNCCKGLRENVKSIAGGIDIARHVDKNVHIKFDRFGNCTHFDHFGGSDWYDIIDRFAENIHEPTLVDSTGIGDAPCEILVKRHPRLQNLVYPVKFSPQTSPVLIQNLIRSAQNGEFLIPRGDITNQLARIQAMETTYGVKYEAPPGHHDDCVDALSLAVYMFNYSLSGLKSLRIVPKGEDKVRGITNRTYDPIEQPQRPVIFDRNYEY